ncbi:MAG TPA: hypothetical protein VGO11_21805 [Chthoniobacteraceae bacterium]|nr:hypothetical protein [Chthoniobacteraceae bacterium]
MRYLLIFLAVATLCGCSRVGRYQIVNVKGSGGSGTIKIDTQTGETWYLRTGNEHAWIPLSQGQP